jgi:2-amino-4-hydroxy-6-hydroxymethyldihydropteridine diphosphokinase
MTMNFPMQKIAYLGLGSNLGDRKENLQLALLQIQMHCGLTTKISSIYETEAWGYSDQPNFYNQVIELLTPLGAQELLQKCLEIELNLGRVRGKIWGERLIDIDILLYNNSCLNLPNLQIPHPYLHQRRFVLVPLAEIAPYVIHPAIGLNAQQLLDQCTDRLKTVVLNEK